MFPIPIEATAKTWAKDRLSAVDYSSDKTATFIIKDASVTEEIEKSEKLFYKDRIVYKANLNVILKISDAADENTAQTEIQAWRELIIPADATIEEKEKMANDKNMYYVSLIENITPKDILPGISKLLENIKSNKG